MGRIVDSKAFAAWFSAAVLAGVSLPIVQNLRQEPVDSFPLSYYPMFSKKRRGKVRIVHIVGYDDDGERYAIPYWFASGGGMNQARKHIKRMVQWGRAEELCERIADNLAKSSNRRYAGVTSVHVVTGRYRLRSYVESGDGLVSEKVHSARPVVRERQAQDGVA